MCKLLNISWFYLQILPEIFPEVQSELLEECGESEGYATVSGSYYF
jgi:hypothetical protein